LKVGDTFVDVGANIGLFSLIASTRVGEKGKVYSFEPAKGTFIKLIQNIDRNGIKNVRCFQAALSHTSAEVSLYSAQQGFDAWNSLAKPYEHQGATEDVETVRSVTWADFAHAERLVGNVSLMKIDVEGWESNVLAGAKSVLEREDAPVLVLEFTDAASRSAGSTCRELYKRTEALGYTLYTYDHLHKVLVLDPIRDEYPYVNLIAAKNIEAVRTRIGCR
jgi:FkbM family methyltransferase